MYQKTDLENGVCVASAYMPDHKSCSCGVWINAGGRLENENNSGISHFIEHLVFKGTAKYSCEKIKSLIEGKGGSLNAFTSEELTCYYAKVLAKDTAQTLKILSSMVNEPLFREKDIKKERTVIVEEIKMYKDLPQSYVLEILDELLWPNQPLGRNLAGSVGSVSSLKRGDFCGYRNKYYTGTNITVAVAGPVKHTEIVDQAKKLFAIPSKSPKNVFERANSRQVKTRHKILFKETEQTHIALGFHALERENPLRYAQGVLNIILGANMSSRLFKRIREQHGLAYAISSHERYFRDAGTFFIHAGLDNKTVEQAIKLILDELEKIKLEFITDGEFTRAKDFYTGQILMGFENTMENMLWVGESQATLKRIIQQEEVIRSINKVKKEEIRSLARKLFSRNNLNLSVIGPVVKNFENNISNLLG